MRGILNSFSCCVCNSQTVSRLGSSLLPQAHFFFLALAFIGFQSSPAGALSLCPLSEQMRSLPATIQVPPNAEAPQAARLGPIDRFYVALAELNGHLDGVPRLVYPLGSNSLSSKGQACLDTLGRLFRSAMRESQGSGAAQAGLVVIGHTDASGSAERNYRLSFERANAVAELLRRYSGRVRAEGRGFSEPWFCGVGTSDQSGVPDAAQIAACKITDAELSAGEGLSSPVERVPPDRRVEIRVAGSSIAGPKLEPLTKLVSSEGGGPLLREVVTGAKGGRGYFVQRMRLYPVETAPLAPVVVEVGQRLRRRTVEQCEAINLPAMNWRLVPTTVAVGKFQERNLYYRMRITPVVTVSSVRPQFFKLEVLLATGLVDQVAPPGDSAALIDEDGSDDPYPRMELGLGVPEYWRTRLRLREDIEAFFGTSGASLLKAAVSDCWYPPGASNASPPDGQLADWIAREVRDSMPLDFDGIWGEAHDHDPRTRMFGLFPGHHLRVMAGGYGLATGSGSSFSNPALFGVQQDLLLYASPVGVFSSKLDSEDLAVQPGSSGNLSVSLDPALASTWQGIGTATDIDDLHSLGDPKIAYNLDDPRELERFLRGRVVRVFQPGPTRGETALSALKDRLLRINTDINFGAPDDLRDTILVGAPTLRSLETFAAFYELDNPAGSIRLADKENLEVLCRALMVPDEVTIGSVLGDRPLSKADAEKLRELGKEGTRCGYFRHNVLMSLLLDVNLRLTELRLPLGTRLGAMLGSDELAPCFEHTGVAMGEKGFSEFPSNAQPDWDLSIRDLGDRFGRPDLVDADDCRLLALPIIEGGNIRW